MPHPDQRRPLPTACSPALSLVRSLEPSNADVLRAVEVLTAKVDQLHALIAPQRSALTLDPDEIARTMAQLQQARPISKETPP